MCTIVTLKMKGKVEDFKEYLPLVSTLFNQGMRERHWAQVSEIVGFPLRPDEDMCLSRLIDMNLDAHVAKFESISEAASKEFSLEKALDKMKTEWAPVGIFKFIAIGKIFL
jgi:dynein heavy chain